MAKRGTKVLPARRAQPSGKESLLLRSAETLGRIIGSLQRQVEGGSKTMSAAADDAVDALSDVPQIKDVVRAVRTSARKAGGVLRRTTKTSTRTRKTKSARKTTAPQASASRKGARKRTASRKATSRKR
jgi:hypothetical protein